MRLQHHEHYRDYAYKGDGEHVPVSSNSPDMGSTIWCPVCPLRIPLQQFGWPHFQRMSQGQRGLNRDVSFAALDATDMIAMQIG